MTKQFSISNTIWPLLKSRWVHFRYAIGIIVLLNVICIGVFLWLSQELGTISAEQLHPFRNLSNLFFFILLLLNRFCWRQITKKCEDIYSILPIKRNYFVMMSLYEECFCIPYLFYFLYILLSIMLVQGPLVFKLPIVALCMYGMITPFIMMLSFYRFKKWYFLLFFKPYIIAIPLFYFIAPDLFSGFLYHLKEQSAFLNPRLALVVFLFLVPFFIQWIHARRESKRLSKKLKEIESTQKSAPVRNEKNTDFLKMKDHPKRFCGCPTWLKLLTSEFWLFFLLMPVSLITLWIFSVKEIGYEYRALCLLSSILYFPETRLFPFTRILPIKTKTTVLVLLASRVILYSEGTVFIMAVSYWLHPDRLLTSYIPSFFSGLITFFVLMPFAMNHLKRWMLIVPAAVFFRPAEWVLLGWTYWKVHPLMLNGRDIHFSDELLKKMSTLSVSGWESSGWILVTLCSVLFGYFLLKKQVQTLQPTDLYIDMGGKRKKRIERDTFHL